MTDIRKPRAGSLAFRPRKRASRIVPRISCWPEVEQVGLLGFAGYKAGMTSVAYIDTTQSTTKGMEVVSGATVIETPPMVVFGVRAYNGGKCWDEYTDDKNILKKLNVKKDKITSTIPEKEDLTDVRVLAYAQPHLTGIGKKHIERMEIGIGGKSVEEKLNYARSLLGKEIHIYDVFKPGQFVDVKAVTKGKGWQGPVKRFGVSLQRRKATGRRRHVGTLGPWHPPYVMYTARQAGQLGFHTRTELNKWIIKIGKAEEVDEINPESGFPHYGFVKNDYIVVKGSVPGTVKRLIRLRLAVRKKDVVIEPKVTFIDRSSKI